MSKELVKKALELCDEDREIMSKTKIQFKSLFFLHQFYILSLNQSVYNKQIICSFYRVVKKESLKTRIDLQQERQKGKDTNRDLPREKRKEQFESKPQLFEKNVPSFS